MASKASSPLAFFLALNLFFFALTCTACSTCPSHNPKPKPTPAPCSPRGASCSGDTLKLGVCADLLGSLLDVAIGKPPVTPCCSVLHGLLDLEAAACLCTALKANILGINLDIPISFSLLLNVCSKNVPSDFVCA